MSFLHRFYAVALAVIALAPSLARAMDDDLRAASAGPTGLNLCGPGSDLIKSGACRQYDLDALTGRIEQSLQLALAKTPANVKPLLKRDQVWFNEMMRAASETVFSDGDDEQQEAFVERLRRRAGTLAGIAQGLGRSGIAGRWAGAFGSVTVTPNDSGYRVAIDSSAVYAAGSERRRDCKATADVKSTSTPWLAGAILPDPDGPTRAADDKSEPSKPSTIKLRRQGDTLRIVIDSGDYSAEERPNCPDMSQLTASYFADGKADRAAATGKPDVSFVAPTFDCTRPSSASDEETCADPDLAENDQRLNRAWKALLPRLDETTRRALTEDQRNWVRAQVNQYPQFLHPAWEKQTSFMHYTVDARDRLDRLQRERVALLEGFDEKRTGLAGVWLSYTAILKVTVANDGSLKTEGWKWDQGDWKAGCDFDIEGKVTGGTFRADGKRKNPDTLERDHAMLIVNRQDDVFAPKRTGEDGDEAKCRRNIQISSTARLFPAKPSPDIDNFGGSIR